MSDNDAIRNAVTGDDLPRAKRPWRTYLVFAGILIVGFVTLLIWKNLEINSVREESRLEKESMVRENAMRFNGRTDELVRSAVLPLAWAIGSELAAKNVGRINEYVLRFIREPNFELVVVADENANVVVSSNKKFEGGTLSEAVTSLPALSSSVMVESLPDGKIRIIAPMVRIDVPIGYLVVVYSGAAADMEGK